MPSGWEPEDRHRKVRDAVSEMYGVPPHFMVSAARPAYVVNARHIGFWVVQQVFSELSFSMIGQLYGGRDHATVIHGVRKVEGRREAEPEFAQRLDAILAAIGEPPRVPSAPSLQKIQEVALQRLPDHTRGEEFDRLFKKSAEPDPLTRAIAADIDADTPRLRAVP